MTALPIYVRARNGSLYKNPVFLFPEGFICCSDRERMEISIWCSDEVVLGAPPDISAVDVLRRVFGISRDGIPGGNGCAAVLDSVTYKSRGMSVVPGTDPWEFRAAISYRFEIDKRTPKPTMHEGEERYASRIRSSTVIDPLANQYDAIQIDIPKEANS